MRICISICSHCGIEYRWQASGNFWSLNTPKEYNDSKYCPSCRKAIVDALSAIPVLFCNKNVGIQDAYEFDPQLKSVTPDYIFELVKKRKAENAVRAASNLFPIMERVFANLYNTETNETSVSGAVTDELSHGFFYRYWPSKPQEMKISVGMRIDNTSGKIVDYSK